MTDLGPLQRQYLELSDAMARLAAEFELLDSARAGSVSPGVGAVQQARVLGAARLALEKWLEQTVTEDRRQTD